MISWPFKLYPHLCTLIFLKFRLFHFYFPKPVKHASLETEEQYMYKHLWNTVVSSKNTNTNPDSSLESEYSKETAISMAITACEEVHIALAKYIGKWKTRFKNVSV